MNDCTRSLIAVLLLLAALLFLCPATVSANNAFNLFEAASADGFAAESPPIILSKVKLDGFEFDELVAVESQQGGYYIPVGAVAAILELGIQVNHQRDALEGFVFSENQRAALDLQSGLWQHGVRTGTLEPSLIARRDDDVYLHTSAWERFLHIRVHIDPYAALIVTEPLEPLPLQERLARERRGGRLHMPQRTVYKRQAPQYHLFGRPSLDQSLQSSIRDDAKGAGIQRQVRYSTMLAADAFFMDTQAIVTGDDKTPLQDYRVTLARRDPEPFLGPVAARSLVFGDMYLRPHQLISASRRIRGAEISNFTLDGAVTPERRSFQGLLQPGWEVELYRNDVLVAYQPAGNSPEYVFQDIAVFPGINTFVLAFYGPQGQRRTETQTINFASAKPSWGDVYYRAAAGLEDSGEPGFQADDDMAFYSLADLQFGLGGPFWASLEGASLLVNEKQSQYGMAGLRMLWRALYGYGDVVQQDDGGRAYHTGLQLGWRHVRILGEHSELQSFTSQEFLPSGDPTLRSSKLGLDLSARWPLSVLLQHELQRNETSSHRINLQPRQRLALRLGRFSIQNSLTGFRSAGDSALLTYLQGATYLSRRFGRVGISSSFDYQVVPVEKPLRAGLQAEFVPRAGYTITPGLSHAFNAQESTVTLNLGKQVGTFAAGFSVRASDKGAYYAGLQVSFGVDAPGASRKVSVNAHSVTRSGTAAPLVYVDSNLNGEYDAGEQPITGVKFKVNDGSTEATTDGNGEAILRGLAPYQHVDIGIDSASLPDTTMQPVTSGTRIVARPGVSTALAFPIVYVGEIDGTLYNAQTKQGIAGVELLVADAQTKRVVQRVRTEYDGYYWLPEIRPGNYLVYPSPKQAKELGFSGLRSKRVVVASNGTVYNGVDFALHKGKPRQTVAAAKLPPKANSYLTALNQGGEVSLSEIGFLPGTSMARGGALRKLDALVALAKARPDLHLILEVHADLKGTPAQAQRLSEQRAAAIRRYLASKGAKVEVKALGNKKPVALSFTYAGRERNNRIVLRLADQT